MEKQNYNINELEQIEYCKVCGKPITKRFNFWDKNQGWFVADVIAMKKPSRRKLTKSKRERERSG